MAEINVAQKKGRRKRYAAPKIDLTPMVDLGFLLITFFIYTTTMAKPKAMALVIPDNESVKSPTAYIDTATITLIPTTQHVVYYYFGSKLNDALLKKTSFGGPSCLRKVLMQKQTELKQLPNTFSKQAHQLQVVIKPANDCTYEDVVNILDEIQINDINMYALVSIAPLESQLVYQANRK